MSKIVKVLSDDSEHGGDPSPIAGAANNQLATVVMGDALEKFCMNKVMA